MIKLLVMGEERPAYIRGDIICVLPEDYVLKKKEQPPEFEVREIEGTVEEMNYLTDLHVYSALERVTLARRAGTAENILDEMAIGQVPWKAKRRHFWDFSTEAIKDKNSRNRLNGDLIASFQAIATVFGVRETYLKYTRNTRSGTVVEEICLTGKDHDDLVIASGIEAKMKNAVESGIRSGIGGYSIDYARSRLNVLNSAGRVLQDTAIFTRFDGKLAELNIIPDLKTRAETVI